MRYHSIGGGILPAIPIAITHSRKKAVKEVRRLTGSVDSKLEHSVNDASTTELFDPVTGDQRFIVLMYDRTDLPASTDAALLAHEAVHVATAYLAWTGVERPDEEIMAYTVGAVSEFLIARHFEWKARRIESEAADISR